MFFFFSIYKNHFSLYFENHLFVNYSNFYIIFRRAQKERKFHYNNRHLYNRKVQKTIAELYSTTLRCSRRSSAFRAAWPKSSRPCFSQKTKRAATFAYALGHHLSRFSDKLYLPSRHKRESRERKRERNSASASSCTCEPREPRRMQIYAK